MIIRSYKPKDYEQVINLLTTCNVEPPIEESDLKGVCIVAAKCDQLVGVIWALVGLSSQGYVDYFAIHPDHQQTKLGWNLLSVMDAALRQFGVKRYTFFIEPDNTYFMNLVEKTREANRVTRLRDLRFFRREIGD